MKKKIILGMVVIILVGAGYFTYDLFKSRDEDVLDDSKPSQDVIIRKVEILPTSSDEYGVSKSSSFKVITQGDISKEDLEKGLNFKPSVDFKVLVDKEDSFEVQPLEPLVSNLVYTVNYDPLEYGKAFQTSEDLRIYQSFPGNEATQVPTKSVIEFKFNGQITSDFEDYFHIEPNVEGQFKYEDNSVVFIPEALEGQQSYTVRVDPGLSHGDRMMEEAYEFSFKTSFGEDYYSRSPYTVHSSVSDQAPIISINSWEQEENYQVSIYSANTFDMYIDWYQGFIKDQAYVETLDGPEVFNSILSPLSREYEDFVELPKLEVGHYLVKISGKKVQQFVFLQIGPHDVYFNENTKGTFFWIMDKTKEMPQEAAEIFINDKAVGLTDEEGVFLGKPFDTIDLITINADGYAYLIESNRPNFYYDFYESRSKKAWSFLYTDRRAYHGTDLVNIFGYLKLRDGTPSEKISLELKHYWDDEVLYQTEISLDKHLSFNASIPLEDLDYGYYAIILKMGQEIIGETEISVLSYEKPEILLQSTASPQVGFSGDTFEYELSASYFNGMPYENMDVEIHFTETTLNQKAQTDENGKINISFEPRVDKEMWYPEFYGIDANSVGLEQNMLRTHAHWDIFPRDIMITSEETIEENEAMVVVKTHAIDLSNYRHGDYDSIKGLALDKELKVSVTETYYEKEEIGVRYDPIHKISYKEYKYEQVKIEHEPFNLSTSNGEAEFSWPTKEGHTYNVIYQSTDQKGRIVKGRSSFGNSFYNYFNIDEIYSLEPSEDKYRVGDLVDKEILKFNEKIQAQAGQWAMVLLFRDGLLDYEIYEGSKFSFEFLEAYRPNVLLKVVYFDKDRMQILPKYGNYLIPYDYESLEAQIKTGQIKEAYKPGETVSLDLDVKDKNGRPFNGVVNVSVVDEAFFSLYEDYFRLGWAIHEYSYFDGILSESLTSDQKEFMDGAEAGEGGDDAYIRENFVDTAYFDKIEIKNGKGQIKFDLPDNLTRFRITLHAVNEDLEYASLKTGVNIKLPYFVRSIYNKAYLKGDDVYLPIRSDGDNYQPGQTITYKVSLEDTLVYENTVDHKGIVQVPIGVLEENQTLTLTGQTSDYQDGIREVLEVKDYFMDFDFMTSQALDPSFESNHERHASKVIFYNSAALDFRKNIYGSYRYSNFRVEEILARYEGEKILKEYFDIDYEEHIMLSRFQGPDGGIKQLTTANSDLETTAKIGATAYGLSYFDTEKLKVYLKNQLMEKEIPENIKALNIWALAALEEPVLIAVDRLLEDKDFDTLSPETQVYILYALLEMNDKTRMETLSDEFFNDIKENDLSAQAYTLAAALDLRVYGGDQKHLDYDIEDVESDESMGLEKIYYLKQVNPSFDGVSLSYEHNSQKIEVSLPDLQVHTLSLKPGDTFQVKEVKGEVWVSEVYKVTALDYEKHTSNTLSLSKKFDSDQVEVGDLIPVRLTFKKPEKSYVQLSDTVPAGFEYVGFEPAKGENVYFSLEHNNQNLKMYYNSEDGSGQITYYIRAIQKGLYGVESSAIYQYLEGNLFMTRPTTIEVK